MNQAQRAKSTTNLYSTLMQVRYWERRQYIAKGSKTCSIILAKLSGDLDPITRYTVANNNNTCLVALALLMLDKESWIAISAKKNYERRLI